MDDIAKEIKSSSQEYSVVFTSGGVGPTHDDVTYEAVAKAFRLKLESHQELVDMYTRMNPYQQEIKRLAIVPKPCKIINVNSAGTENLLTYSFTILYFPRKILFAYVWILTRRICNIRKIVRFDVFTLISDI